MKIITWAYWPYQVPGEILKRIIEGEDVRKFNPTSYGSNEPDDPVPDRHAENDDE